MRADVAVDPGTLAARQNLNREVNERIGELGWADALEDQPAFVCEFSRPDCRQTLERSRPEYGTLRASPIRFGVTPGHELDRVERVAAGNVRYLVAENVGEAAESAAPADPGTDGRRLGQRHAAPPASGRFDPGSFPDIAGLASRLRLHRSLDDVLRIVEGGSSGG
jgi:hypothetical protein